MELPFEKTVCRYWKQKLYQLHTQEATQELRLPEGMPDVGRVIAAWGQVILRGKEWRDRGLGINGGVMVWVLYQPEGEGEPQRLESWVPFQSRLDMPPSDADGVIRVETLLRGVDARITSSRKLMVRCSVGLLVQALVPDETVMYVPGELPEDLEVLRDSCSMNTIRETGEKTFLIDEVLEFDDAETLVYFVMEPELLEQKVLGSKAVFRGMGNLHVLYRSEAGKLRSHDFRVPFAQYVDLEGDYESEAQVSNVFCVTSLELDMEDNGLHLRCGMVSQYTILAPETYEYVADAYSPCRDVDLQLDEVTIPDWLQAELKEAELSGKLTGDGELVDVTREGEGFSGLLEGTDGTLTQKNAQTDMDDTVAFSWRKGELNTARSGGDWRVDTQVVWDLSAPQFHPRNVVTAMELGPERAPDPERPSVVVRAKGKGDSLWSLAKRCGSTVGAIRKMNKLDDEPEDDRLLLIPVI